jgi:Protein of unknown function (DUF559)
MMEGHMPRFTPKVSDLFARQHAVACRQQLLAEGLSVRQIEQLYVSGLTVPVFPGVYRIAAAPFTELAKCVAACLWRDDLVVSHHTAGRIQAIRRLGLDLAVHVTIPGPERVKIDDVEVHRCHRLDQCDIVTRPDGIRLTTVARTIFDMSALRPDAAIESMIEQALHERWVSLDEFQVLANRLRQHGRRGSARFGDVLKSRGKRDAVASGLELRFERAVVAAGLPQPIRQAPIPLRSGETIHPDFFWPDKRLVVEIDHIAWHGTQSDRTRDGKRDRELRALGLSVQRVSDADIREHLDDVVIDVGGLLGVVPASRSRQSRI